MLGLHSSPFCARISVVIWKLIVLKIVGSVSPEIVVPYLESLRPRLVVSKSNYSNSRSELWLRRRWVGPKFVPAAEDSRISALGDRILPGWGTCGIFWSLGIRPHRDHRVFGDRVVSVNLGPCIFAVGGEKINLNSGKIIEFSSRLEHSVECENHRWSIVFWDLPAVEQLVLF